MLSHKVAPTARAARTMIARLAKTYHDARCALRFSNPLEILVATILSAQCTDKRVNIVTTGLFKKYPDVAAYAAADSAVFEQDIRSTGFFRNKARNISAAARMIIERFGGVVPQTMEELIQLPGVARKTANIVLLNGYGIVAGIPVDTHVLRLSHRLGLSVHDDPVKVEQDLMALVSRTQWGRVSYWLIEHGRAVCVARSPRCAACVIGKQCPRIDVGK